eukprot:6187853-Pleurochrysis_carterae.AAC.2
MGGRERRLAVWRGAPILRGALSRRRRARGSSGRHLARRPAGERSQRLSRSDTGPSSSTFHLADRSDVKVE